MAPPTAGDHGRPSSLLGRVSWAVLAVGLPALIVSLVLDPGDAGAAVRQDWPPFVLVSGLLLLGLVARYDGLFDAGGAAMARLAGGGFSLLASATVLVAVVTAVLNLDTAVAFLTPVLVVAARRRRTDETPFLYLAVFLANGASLLLPGSNLTNLIVIGDRHLSGGAFAAAMLPAWIAASVSIPLVLAIAFRRELSVAGARVTSLRSDPRLGVGLAGVCVAVAAMLVLSGDTVALVVVATGSAAVGWRLARKRVAWDDVRRTVDVPVLVGLFGLAVALGTLGREWSGPSWLLAHASSWEAAAVGAVTSVVCNNLPAASLLAARPTPDPHALLVGLNLGPNLAVTGALSAVLWLQVSRTAGARPSPARYTRLGLVVVPVSMAAALGALAVH
jgi:arsenical pump membrane protein